MLQHLLHGLTSLGSVQALAYLFLGSLIGVFIGVIPGLGGAVVLSVVLAFTYHIDLTGTLCLFLGTYAGSYYSASVTSILLNTPAHPEAFAVTLDGFPMAQRGQAGRALGLSAASTCIGGFVGCLLLVAFIQVMDYLPSVFHPPEYVALVTVAMVLVGTLGTDSVSKAVASMGLGLSLSAIGPSIITGTFRYTFGSASLYGGISLVAIALGLLAVPQMVMIYGVANSVARQDMTGREIEASSGVELEKGFGAQLLGGIGESLRYWRTLIQSGVTGALAGLIPGMGGFTANFLSYGVAQQTSRRRAEFGTGIPEGIIAPEGASLAKEAGSMVPLLSLGIPGSVGGALFLAALTIKGIATGYGFAKAYPTIPYEIVWVIALAGLIGTVAGVLVGPLLARVTRVPGPALVPFIFCLVVIGPFVSDTAFAPVVEALLFGVVGLVLRRLRFSLASLVMGLVLGPTFESNIGLIRTLYPGFSFVGARPFADALFALAILILIGQAVVLRRQRASARAAARAAAELSAQAELSARADAELSLEAVRPPGTARAPGSVPGQRRRWLRIASDTGQRSPYPLLSLIISTLLLAVSVWFVLYGAISYNLQTSVFPVISGLLVAVPMAFKVPVDLAVYLRARRDASGQPDASGQGEAGQPAIPDTVGPVSAGLIPAVPAPVAPAVATLTEQQELSASAQAKVAIRLRAWGRNAQYTRELGGFLWLTGLVAACYIVGFEVAIPVFVAIYALTGCRHAFPALRTRIVFAIIGAAVMWAATHEIFNLASLLFVPLI